MAQLQFTFREGNTVDVIVLDATLTERHSFTADVTESPVEEGASVSDNVRRKPDMLTLDGFIADYPIPKDGRSKAPSAGPSDLSRPKKEDLRSVEALKKLRRIQAEGVLVTVETGVTKYDSMVLQSIDLPRDSKTGAGFRVTLNLKQVRIVETKTVTVQRAQTNKGKGKVDIGKQEKKNATAGEKSSGSARRSALGAIVKSLTGG